MKTLAIFLALTSLLHAQAPIKNFQAPNGTTYQTQNPTNGTITLDPNNGFFKKGTMRAADGKPAPPADKKLISQHFSHLTYIKPNGTAYWHIYIQNPGSLTISPNSTSSLPETWDLSIEGKKHNLLADTPLEIEIEKAGKHTLQLTRTTPEPPKDLKLNSLTLTGPAITGAKLIRARWRPAAIHTTFASSTCPTTKLWVFETQTLTPTSNYSPLTTAFGYFGATFNANKKAAGGINFSMWAANKKTEIAPPLSASPRIIATGNPKAEFSGFGHEGSGVKIRNWQPFAHHPTSVIQALRLETGPKYNTYHAYIYNETNQSWLLYASGQKPHQKNKKQTHLRTTSFCEIPGPPSIERTGDQPRLIRRRGWLMDEQNQWHPIDQIHFKNKNNQPTSKTIGSQPGGWLTMGTGGVAMQTPQTTIKITPPKTLPPYLTTEKTKQLYTLPATFKTNSTSEITTNSATITYTLEDIGTNPTATIYYGEKNAITSIARKLHGTENKGVSKKMLATNRVWKHNAKSASIKENTIQFNLKNLKPNTTYHHRILITNDQGKTWHPTTNTFKTK